MSNASSAGLETVQSFDQSGKYKHDVLQFASCLANILVKLAQKWTKIFNFSKRPTEL